MAARFCTQCQKIFERQEDVPFRSGLDELCPVCTQQLVEVNSNIQHLSGARARAWLRMNKIESRLPRAGQRLLIGDPPSLPAGFTMVIDQVARPEDSSEPYYLLTPIPRPGFGAAA